jgi:hypothetical protein
MYIKTGTSTWKNTAELYVKTGTSVWSRVKQGYIKTSSTLWKRFFFEANLPGVTTKPSIRETNTGSGTMYDGPVATSPQYLDADLYGKDGVYTNYTSITSRRFSWADTEDSTTRSTVVFDDRFNTAGGITTSTRLSLDEDYLFYEVQVNNGTGDDFINPVSNPIKLIKKEPALGPFTTSLTGNASPNSTLTFNYNLENYYYNRVEQGNSKIRWWRSSSQSPSGTLLKEETISATLTSSDSSSLSGQSTYTIAASADNDSYIVVEILAGSSWTRHFAYGNEYQLDYFSTAKVQAPYRFSFGKTIYVGTNGYIGLDAGAYSAAGLPFGRAISVFVKDFTQYYLAEYSDSSVYYLYIKSYLYNTSAASSNALDYQIKFYNDPNINYCDVYIVRKGANVPSLSDFAPGYYGDYGQPDPKYAGMAGPYFIGQGTTFRVYFGDAAAYTGVVWTSVSDAIWDVIQTWSYPPGLDDDFTAVVSAANQSAPAPTNTSLPTLSTDTGNFSAGSTITINPGTWTGTNSYAYELLYSNSSPVSTSSATKTLVNTNQYVITNADATNPSYYFRGRVTGYGGFGQSGLSQSAVTDTSARSNINPTTTISVGSATSSGFTISGTAGPLSGFGTTYANITSIQIFNNSLTPVATITSGLPTVNGTSGSWSYTWAGHSGGATTYYARATVAATDTSQTLFTTGYAGPVTTLTPVTTPGAVQNLSSSTITGGARISWSAPSSDGGSPIIRYEIKRDTFSYFSVGNTNSYDYTLSGGTYTIYVRAVNAVGSGTESAISVTVPSIPTITMNANTNVTTSGATINWSSTNQSYAYVDSLYVGNVNSYTFSFLGSGTTYSGTVTVYSSSNNSASANYSFTTSSVSATPAITSGPSISWGSGNNFTLSATASNATNIEFQVQFANTSGGTVQNTVTYFMGASAGSRTTGAQQYSWARTRARANNSSTGLSSAFTAYTGWA